MKWYHCLIGMRMRKSSCCCPSEVFAVSSLSWAVTATMSRWYHCPRGDAKEIASVVAVAVTFAVTTPSSASSSLTIFIYAPSDVILLFSVSSKHALYTSSSNWFGVSLHNRICIRSIFQKMASTICRTFLWLYRCCCCCCCLPLSIMTSPRYWCLTSMSYYFPFPSPIESSSTMIIPKSALWI